ncbi:uncharacterized protein LOC105261819 [Musca domestica]|uniref:Uncharacterized protein LOC105261819 n=1 Tax=Musca domestica TaxID=7370 RepID=A0A1I8NKZ3_MUSDO|nr:uncharacterized protein LOC105261819 [Musca domestica]
MKVILCAVVVLVACVTLAVSHTQTWGKRLRGDRLLYNQIFVTLPRPGTGQIRGIRFPTRGNSNSALISEIYIVDNFKNQTGFVPILKSGGPGRAFATIELRGYYGKGFNGTIRIFGK